MRKLVNLSLLLLAISAPVQAWTWIGQCANTVNACSINTTGANLILVTLGSNGGGIPTTSDALANTWVQVPSASLTSVVYCSVPTVTGADTFGVLALNGASYNIGISAAAFSGGNASCTPNVYSAGSYLTATTVQPGSITPTYTDVLLITSNACHSTSGAVPTVDSGFTALSVLHSDSTGWSGAGLAYKIMATPSAINPTWTAPDSAGQSSVIAAFLASDSVPYSGQRTRHRVVGGQ
jgi:hypothetical protein